MAFFSNQKYLLMHPFVYGGIYLHLSTKCKETDNFISTA